MVQGEVLAHRDLTWVKDQLARGWIYEKPVNTWEDDWFFE